MSLEDFQWLDNEPLDNSIIKRDFTKIYHRQGDQLNQIKILNSFSVKTIVIIR